MLRLVTVSFLIIAGIAKAGLHYSGEKYNELPSRWRGFLLDQRLLRQVSVRGVNSSLRQQYDKEAMRLLQASRTRSLTADESADLGALLVRLGDSGKAIEVLRPAHRSHPQHFRIAANLGTAWQVQGDYSQAIAALEEAVRLAPGKYLRAEQAHLKLVRLRQRDRPGTSALDRLFEIEFIGPSGRYVAGELAASQRKILPSSAIATVQQLALWLPDDARLLWLLAELANAQGDIHTAAAIFEGCVGEFGLRHATLQAHRKIVRDAAEALAARGGSKDKKLHQEHALLFQPRSSRPLSTRIDLNALPPIDPTGVNALAWEVIGETTLDRKGRPTFPQYLRELDGKQVVLRGYMQPLAENTDFGAFLLIEHPIGCWFCEMPEMASIVLVELPAGESGRYSRDPLTITGKLLLNPTDPEHFLYTIREARMSDEKVE